MATPSPKTIPLHTTEQIAELEVIRGIAVEAWSKLGPTGYFPSMGAPLSDRMRNALAKHAPSIKPIDRNAELAAQLAPDLRAVTARSLRDEMKGTLKLDWVMHGRDILTLCDVVERRLAALEAKAPTS